MINLTPPSSDVADRLARLEARLARLEDYVGLDEPTFVTAPGPRSRGAHTADELELEMGQTWFARVGIIALAAGGGFMLTLPYPDLPPPVPALAGVAVAGSMFALAHFGHRAFPLVSRHLRGASMALAYCAVLRFVFFGVHPVFPRDSALAALLLSGVAALNLAIAWRRHSVALLVLALATAATTPLAIGSATFVLPATVCLAVLTCIIAARPKWRIVYPVGIILTEAVYFTWSMGNPLFGGAYHWAATPAAAPYVLLLVMIVFGLAPVWWRHCSNPDDLPTATGSGLVAALGYTAFLIHTYAVGMPHWGAGHILASLACLWMAADLWLRFRSEIATFFYAMCGYAALTAAIVKITSVPNTFVWLSVESLMVVATAIWFRSRFIIVANFLIYAAVVLGYVFLNEHETGVSLGFGVVALASARILNWKRHRLALQTDLMRNAYLLSAFVVFPYALAHLVPAPFVALAWVALAVAYYGFNFAIRNEKYRWMAHATLALTAGYLLVPSHPGLTPAYRIASFLSLGATLIAVSLLFTRSRRRGPPARIA